MFVGARLGRVECEATDALAAWTGEADEAQEDGVAAAEAHVTVAFDVVVVAELHSDMVHTVVATAVL